MFALHGIEHVTITSSSKYCTIAGARSLVSNLLCEVDRSQYLTFIAIIEETFFDLVEYLIVIVIMETEHASLTAVLNQPLRG
jgi:hypothetical protein